MRVERETLAISPNIVVVQNLKQAYTHTAYINNEATSTRHHR